MEDENIIAKVAVALETYHVFCYRGVSVSICNMSRHENKDWGGVYLGRDAELQEQWPHNEATSKTQQTTNKSSNCTKETIYEYLVKFEGSLFTSL
jgi:hypothetical protein